MTGPTKNFSARTPEDEGEAIASEAEQPPVRGVHLALYARISRNRLWLHKPSAFTVPLNVWEKYLIRVTWPSFYTYSCSFFLFISVLS
jgi:hypothetical protein